MPNKPNVLSNGARDINAIDENIQALYDAFVDWTDVEYSASDFTAESPMIVSFPNGAENLSTFSYKIVNDEMTIELCVCNITLGGGVADSIKVKIPGGRLAFGGSYGLIMLVENGSTAKTLAYTAAASGSDKISIHKLSGADFTPSVANNWIFGRVVLRLQPEA